MCFWIRGGLWSINIYAAHGQCDSSNHKNKVVKHLGIPRGGANPRRGYQPIIWQRCVENCMKMKIIEPRGRIHSPALWSVSLSQKQFYLSSVTEHFPWRFPQSLLTSIYCPRAVYCFLQEGRNQRRSQKSRSVRHEPVTIWKILELIHIKNVLKNKNKFCWFLMW